MKKLNTSRLFFISWSFVTILVLIVELTLLNLKYQTFTGGFLQDHQISKSLEIVKFIFGVWLLNALFYGFMFLTGILYVKKFRKNSIIYLYHIIWITLGGSLFLIALRYQLHSYFGDFLTFSVIKNLGGGSVFDAILYAIQEGGLVISSVAVAVFSWWSGTRLLLKRFSTMTHSVEGFQGYLACWFGSAIGVFSLTMLLNTNQDFRYHLNRTTAFLNTKLLIQLILPTENNSYQLEIPDNGIDEDGLAGDLHFTQEAGNRYRFIGPKKHVILIVLESVRGDVLGQNLNGQPVTPRMSQIATDGMSLKDYYSHSGYTTSSLEAIFTSSPAPVSDRPILLETLKENGYTISVISGQDESFGGISSRIGSRSNANFYFDASTAPEKRAFFAASPGGLVVPNEVVVSQFKSAIGTGDLSKPNFFYINLQSAHFPYFYQGMPMILTKHPIARSDIKSSNRSLVKITYLNAVAAADRSIGEIVDELKRIGIYENTALMIVGDHGESLFDDGLLGHGMRISEDQLNTIFVTNQQLSVNHPIGHASLSPIILKMAGAEIDVGAQKESDFVFHFVGSLDNPTYISGTFDDHQRLIYGLSERQYQTEDARGLVTRWRVADVVRDAELNRRFNSLFSTWAALRWKAYLNKQDANKSPGRTAG